MGMMTAEVAPASTCSLCSHLESLRFFSWQVTAGIIANRAKMTWPTKEGVKTSNYFGSVTQASTTQIGTNAAGSAVHVPLKNLLPMVNPNDLVIGGWDISKVSGLRPLSR